MTFARVWVMPDSSAPLDTDSRLVVVSNRLPVRRTTTADGARAWKLSPGGLVGALRPILRDVGGEWIGWTGCANDACEAFEHEGIHLQPVSISPEELDDYYEGYCNRSVWPLYHDCVRPPRYDDAWWTAYERVNRRYAAAAVEAARRGDHVWVQDYQLQLVPGMLREGVPDARIGFFLHIPFPPLELFAQLPQRREILESLLAADIVGFQTAIDARNFSRAARHLAGARRRGDALGFRGREVRVGAFPISIDTRSFEALAREPRVRSRAARIRESFGHRRIVLGVDRLDYTKGIVERLNAFEALLHRRQDLARDLVLVQIAVPSRESVPEYVELRAAVERIVGRINGEFGTPDHTPVHFFRRSFPHDELAAFYVAADVMAVTAIRDGMNLVAKEYVASRIGEAGALVLSEFAGSARELRDAILVNPHDVHDLERGIAAALDMPIDEARTRMRRMRRVVRENDVFHWAREFVRCLESPGVTVRTADSVRTPRQNLPTLLVRQPGTAVTFARSKAIRRPITG